MRPNRKHVRRNARLAQWIEKGPVVPIAADQGRNVHVVFQVVLLIVKRREVPVLELLKANEMFVRAGVETSVFFILNNLMMYFIC